MNKDIPRASWKSWVSPNDVWEVVATVKENPGFPNNEKMAFRHVKIRRFNAVAYEKYSDDGRTPKYVMDKYREFTELIYR